MTPVESLATASTSADRIGTAWRDGGAPDAAAALRDHPEPAANRSIIIQLAYDEYLELERSGTPPDPAEFARRFPNCQSSVQDLIEAYCLLKAEPQRLPIPEATWPAVGEKLEGLELRRELGRGAFGRAYLAFDPALGRLRVVKITPGGGAEARVIGGLHHPHVTDVLWTRPVGDRTAVCMPFVGAATLASLLEMSKGRTPSARLILEATSPATGEPPATHAAPAVFVSDSEAVAAAAVGAKLARAIAYLHEEGVAHGDVKPSNVVLQPGGSPQVIDFNLAAGEEPEFAIRGTPAYMAPELLDAALAGRRPVYDGEKADVFALGVTLIELTTGAHPYRLNTNGNLAALAVAAWRCQPAVGALPAALGDLLKRALALKPAARPTAAELADALDRFVDRARTRGCRRRRIAVAACAGVLLAGLLGAAFLRPSSAMERSPESAAEFRDRGLAALREGKADAARADFLSAHERGADPHDLALAAYCYSLGGDQDVALEMSRKALEAGADGAEVRNNRGAAYLKLNKPDEAVKELDAALALSMDLRVAKYNRAVARFALSLDPRRGDLLPLALADMDDVVSMGPYSSEFHMDAARIYAKASLGNPGLRDRAFEQLDSALKLGQSPEKIGKELVFKQNLAGDPRFVEIIGRKQQPTVPPTQLHFVEPLRK